MSSTATITAYTGPDIHAAALVLPNVTGINFDLNAGVLFVSTANGQISQFALTGSNTITLTASGGNYTLTVS